MMDKPHWSEETVYQWYMDQISWRVRNHLCFECGAGGVAGALCDACRKLPRYQEILSLEITFDPKYYLVVGCNLRAQKLRDCKSDHIELAEHEAHEVLSELRANGDVTSIVRVVEAETGLVVYHIK